MPGLVDAHMHTLGPEQFTRRLFLLGLSMGMHQDGMRLVEEYRAAGYDLIKVYNDLSQAGYRGVMLKARDLRVPVVWHVVRSMDVEGVTAAGQCGIAHMEEYIHTYFGLMMSDTTHVAAGRAAQTPFGGAVMKPWLLAVPACCLTVFGCAPAHTTVSMPLPSPEAAIEDASPQQEAAALMLRILDLTGGAGVWRAVANVVSELEAKLFTPEGERFATSKIVLRPPGDMHRANVLEGLGTIDMLVRGERTWFKPPQQDAIRSAEPFEAEYIQAGLWRDLPFLLARVARGDTEGLQLSAMPDAERDGRRYHVLQVQPPRGLQGYRLYIDAATALPAMRVFKQGDAEVRDVFGDFRMHASVQLPWALRSYRDGTLTEDIRYTAIHVNATVDERMFAVN